MDHPVLRKLWNEKWIQRHFDMKRYYEQSGQMDLWEQELAELQVNLAKAEQELVDRRYSDDDSTW